MRGTSFLLLLLAACLLPGGQAAACPGSGEPCAVDGGVYRARLPAGAPRGVVVFLHGWGGTAAAQIAQADVVEPLLARGYAVVAPQGAPRRPGDSGGAWNAAGRADGRDDAAFLAAVLADARARFDLARAPALAAGFSGGGMMVWRLACATPGAFDAYAPVAGLLWRPLPDGCVGPVRLLHAHGWADAVVPLEGRAVGGGRIVQGDLFEGLALLRRAGGCADDAPDAYDASGPFLRRFWADCAAGGALGLALWPGGHVTPGAWADMTLDWFEASGD
jgi:polyhydroxybutyrate depolymerase